MAVRQRKSYFPPGSCRIRHSGGFADVHCFTRYDCALYIPARQDTDILVLQRVERFPPEYQRGRRSYTRSRYWRAPERPNKIPGGRITGHEIELDLDIIVRLLIS